MVGLSSESAYLLQICLELFAGCPLSYRPITHNALEYSPKRQIYLSEDLSIDAKEKEQCFGKGQYCFATTPILGYKYNYI